MSDKDEFLARLATRAYNVLTNTDGDPMFIDSDQVIVESVDGDIVTIKGKRYRVDNVRRTENDGYKCDLVAPVLDDIAGPIMQPSNPFVADVSGVPIYLGDGLFVEDQGYQFRLFASDGIQTTNEVWLDRSMISKLAQLAEVI